MTDAYRLLLPRPMAKKRLILFPFAGAGAHSFRGLLPFLPEEVEPWVLQLPGREDRMGLSPLTLWEDAATAASGELRLLAATHPVILYGHSLGALFALHMAEMLEKTGHGVEHVVIGAPPLTDAAGPKSDAEVSSRLEALYGPLPDSFAVPEIIETAMPALQADLELLAAAPPADRQPNLLLLGEDDPSAQSSQQRYSAIRTKWISGGHYFPLTHPEAVVKAIFASALT